MQSKVLVLGCELMQCSFFIYRIQLTSHSFIIISLLYCIGDTMARKTTVTLFICHTVDKN